MQSVIAAMLNMMEMEPAKPARPISPPQRAVNIGASAETGEKTTSASTWRITSGKGVQKYKNSASAAETV